MVSSAESGGVGFGVVDGRPGTIVWVRRRNGSWWPGRILGPEDLSASHLMSPRSGTPVKLLGREDASVDWYNLEKSKRVKAFRCGEFDDCIERASASQGLPAKKREKYARREDAILHALELEKKFIETKPAKLVQPKKSLESERKLSVAPVRALENGNGRLANHDSSQPGKRAKLMDKNGGVPLLSQKPKDAIHPSLEDHGALLSSHVRGLQDYNYKAVPLRMLYSNASEDSNRNAADAHAYAISGSDPAFQNSSDSDSRNSFGKGKRLREAYVEDSISKRQRVFHPLVSARQNSAELPNHSLQLDMYANRMSGDGVRCSVYTPAQSSQMFSSKQNPQAQMDMPFHRPEPGTHHRQHGAFVEETASGSSEETESDSSETHSIEPHVESAMLLSDAETRMPAQPRLCDRLQAGQESTSGDESDELSLDDRSQFHYLDQNASGSEVSKWQLKGKRNVRNLGKRPMDSCSQRTNFDARGRPLNQRATIHSLSYYHDNGFANDADFSEDDFDPHTNGFGQRGYLPSQAAARRQSYIGSNMNDWDLAWGRPFRGYWDERGAWLSPMFIGGNGHDMLIDVDLTVQANRQGEHVPWVSLMSKLNGKAIIGHPIQIETLEDGSTDFLLSTSDDFRYDSDRCKVPPVWRTARRTASVRVPRPQQLDVDEDTDYQHLHQSGKVRSKKSFAPSTVRKGSLSKITQSYVSRSPEGVKKAPRKGNLPSNQKTKPLSSIGFDQKVPNKASDHDSGYYMDGVIKPVESGPPTVACIPVKLAFSRLLEAVGRPPSGPAKHGVSVNSNKERNPS